MREAMAVTVECEHGTKLHRQLGSRARRLRGGPRRGDECGEGARAGGLRLGQIKARQGCVWGAVSAFVCIVVSLCTILCTGASTQRDCAVGLPYAREIRVGAGAWGAGALVIVMTQRAGVVWVWRVCWGCWACKPVHSDTMIARSEGRW